MVQGLRILAVPARFCSQHPHDSSQLSVTPIPEDPRAAFDFHIYQECTHGINANICTYKNEKSKFKI